MQEDRDYALTLEPNHRPHIQLHPGERIQRVWFSVARKFRHSTLHVVTAGADGEREQVWHWCEMPRELADLCSVLLSAQRGVSHLLEKLNGRPGDEDWRCE